MLSSPQEVFAVQMGPVFVLFVRRSSINRLSPFPWESKSFPPSKQYVEGWQSPEPPIYLVRKTWCNSFLPHHGTWLGHLFNSSHLLINHHQCTPSQRTRKSANPMAHCQSRFSSLSVSLTSWTNQQNFYLRIVRMCINCLDSFNELFICYFYLNFVFPV